MDFSESCAEEIILQLQIHSNMNDITILFRK